MKRLWGIIPFIVYAAFAALFIYVAKFAIELIDENELAQIPMEITHNILMVFALIPLSLAVFKFIHLISGWGFFAALCIIADLIFAAIFFFAAFSAELDATTLAFGLGAVVMMIFNIASCRK